MSMTHNRATKQLAAWDGRDMHDPDLIGCRYGHVPEQGGVGRVSDVPDGRSALSVDTVDPQLSKQRGAMTPAR